MDKSTSSNSSGTSSKLAYCACCHNFGQVTPHWDHRDVLLCHACRPLLYAMAGNFDLTHTAYAFMNRLDAGGL